MKKLSKHPGCPACGRTSAPGVVCARCLDWIAHSARCGCADCKDTSAAHRRYHYQLTEAAHLAAGIKLAADLTA